MGAFVITISIKDAKGAEAKTSFNFPSTYAFDDVILFAAQQAERIGKLIKGRIVRATVSQDADLTAVTVPTTADPDSDVEEGAYFQFGTAGGFTTSQRIPTFDESKFISGTKLVDLTDTDVDDYVTVMQTGAPVVALGGVLSPSDQRDDDITTLNVAKEQFQKSRKSGV